MTRPMNAKRLAELSPADAAAHWLIARDSGIPEEIGLFEKWLTDSEENLLAWHDANAAWATFDDIEADASDLDALREAAWSDASNATSASSGFRWTAVAATVALVALLGLVVFARPETRGGGEVFAQSYLVAPGTREQLVLPDGTKISADPQTRFAVAFDSRARNVEFAAGKASFEVAHDAERPFTVEAAGQRVRALGTRFTVVLRDEHLTVHLSQGSVEISGNGSSTLTLVPGETYTSAPGGAAEVSSAANSGSAIESGHQQSRFEFNDVPLSRALAQVNANRAVQIIVTDEKIAAMRISGTFSSDDPEIFAKDLASLLGLEAKRRGSDEWELVRR